MTAKASVGGFLATLVLVCFVHCGQVVPPSSKVVQPPATGGILRIMAQSMESLDPIHSRNYWESGIVLQLFDGLLRFDDNLAIAPALAEDWQVSFDGKTYTFQLRRGARFHNGRPVTAKDFVYSLTRLIDPQWKAVDSEYYSRILGAREFRSGRASTVSGLKALGHHTLQISLEQAYAPFLHVLSLQSASVVPREAVESKEKPFGRSPVGTGAFRLTSWGPAGEIRLESNSGYFLKRPYLDGIFIRTVPALNDRDSFQEFSQGNLDLSFVPNDQISQALARPDWVVKSFPVLRLLYLGMNMKDPTMRNPLLRKAISLAIDRKTAYGGLPDFELTNRLIPFSLLGSSRQPLVTQDLEAARRAVLESKRVEGHSPNLSLWYSTRLRAARQRLERLSDGVRSIGLKIDIKIADSLDELLERIYSGKAQIFLLGEVIDFPDPDALLSRLFHSKSNGNPFGYHNQRVDRMLLKARETREERRRAQLYQQIEEQILSDHVMVPLALVRYSLVRHRRVRGFEVNPLGFQYFHFRKVWLSPN